MPVTPPVVGVLKGMRDGSLESISLDFRYAPELRHEAVEAFTRALVGNNVGLDEPTITVNRRPHAYDFLIELGRPTRNMPLIDSLLRVVAHHCGYTMQIEEQQMAEFEEQVRAVFQVTDEAKPREERGNGGGFAGRGRPSWRDDPQG